jgi:hypothetical protein
MGIAHNALWNVARAKAMEEIINANGLEHLITILPLPDLKLNE